MQTNAHKIAEGVSADDPEMAGGHSDSEPRTTGAEAIDSPRTLIAIGTTADGSAILLGSPAHRGETVTHTHPHSTDGADQFVLPIDDRLRRILRSAPRAASHGTLGREDGSRDAGCRTAHRGSATPADWENDMTSQLRPKEIQTRIRAGATVEQVAAAAGCPVERIEGFAYPVLLERSTMAERAQATYPLRGAPIGSIAAGHADRTLAEIVANTLAERGHRSEVTWDAYKDERGWTVTLTWMVGRTENRAEWAFNPQPSGGTVTARNAEAADLVEPVRSPLRPVESTPRGHRPGDSPADDAPADQHAADHDGSAPADTAVPAGASSVAPRPSRRGHRPPMPSWEDVLLGTRTTGTGTDRP